MSATQDDPTSGMPNPDVRVDELTLEQAAQNLARAWNQVPDDTDIPEHLEELAHAVTQVVDVTART